MSTAGSQARSTNTSTCSPTERTSRRPTSPRPRIRARGRSASPLWFYACTCMHWSTISHISVSTSNHKSTHRRMRFSGSSERAMRTEGFCSRSARRIATGETPSSRSRASSTCGVTVGRSAGGMDTVCWDHSVLVITMPSIHLDHTSHACVPASFLPAYLAQRLPRRCLGPRTRTHTRTRTSVAFRPLLHRFQQPPLLLCPTRARPVHQGVLPICVCVCVLIVRCEGMEWASNHNTSCTALYVP